MSKDRPKETELEDLQRRARSLQGTPEQIIKRRDRAVLLHQIAKYSERSPNSIKKFLDLNADSIVELHQAYEQLGRKELVDSFRKLVEDLVNPIRADKAHAQQVDDLMAKLSGVTVKSSQVEEKGQLAKEINQLADEIDGFLKDDLPKAASSKPGVKHNNDIDKQTENKAQDQAAEKRWWKNQVDQRGMMAKEPKAEKQKQSSSTAQLFNNIAPKADILSSVSVKNPLAGVKAASVVRADPAGLINAKPKQEQVAEKQKKPGLMDVLKNKLKI